MKEKVERLAKGIFECDTPSILLSDEELLVTVEAGKTYYGSFTIKNSLNRPMRGILYSSSKLLKLEQDCFTEAVNEIQYSFIADNMCAGETTCCDICIVSDCGELQIPVIINTEVPYFNSSLGKIKDLYNFANLAKSDWAEALKLFKSSEFGHFMIHYESNHNVLYQNLLKSRSTSQAMEEFLIAIHKKLRVTISANKTKFEYEANNERFMDKLILTKDNWGYTEIRVSTNSDFITLEHKIIWSDNFIGNHYSLEFILDPNHMRDGNNYGRIYLKTIHQTITIDIACKCKKGKVIREPHRTLIKFYAKKMTENYLDFRSNQIQLNNYVEETSVILDGISLLNNNKEVVMFQFIRIHLLLISGKEIEAKQILDNFNDKINEWKQTEVLYYCTYLYLQALLTKEEGAVTEARITIRGFYEREYYSWKLLWILLYIDTKYDQNKTLRLDDIKKHYKEGCHSPILYYEAISVFNDEPFLLHELGEFELQVINWGVKQDCLSQDLAIQVSYLAGKYKGFHKLLYCCLTSIYNKYKSKDTLTAICSMLIKGHQRSNKYFEWYRLGVEEQLRITDIHEYYMYSIDETAGIVLPQPILIYFIYNSNLNDRKKAFLYAYIIKNKDTFPEIYQTYYKHIEQFVLKQITQHNINANLSILYDEIIAQNGLKAEFAMELPYIMFKNEITCNNPNIKGVYVIHKEAIEEVYYPFTNSVAQVDIYTQDAEIELVDGYDNRYVTTVEYTLNKLMHWEDYIYTCYELGVNHPTILLSLSDKALAYQKFDDISVNLRMKTAHIPGLNEGFHKRIIQELIFYYYDNFKSEQLEPYLLEIDIHGANKAIRNKIIELYIIRDFYDQALASLKEFGFDGIAVNRLIKLSTNLIQKNPEPDEKSEILVNLCYYIFKAGKYNEDILKYLVKFFFGTTSEMFTLWKTSIAFEIDTMELEERLLAQMLFAESYLADSISVFMEYYKKGCNHKLIRALLSYNAYKYLVKDRIIQSELFPIMRREIAFEENEVCMLAILKELSEHDNLTDSEIDLVDFNINKLVKQGIVMPYFTNFKDKIALPCKLLNKYYVEYKTNPSHIVTIHYRMEGKNFSEEFLSERMKPVCYGIYVKEFLLFYNERIQYYISEEDAEGNTNITESMSVQLNQDMQLDEDTKYNHINFMLTAMDLQDDKTLMESIDNYVKMNYVISHLFKPL